MPLGPSRHEATSLSEETVSLSSNATTKNSLSLCSRPSAVLRCRHHNASPRPSETQQDGGSSKSYSSPTIIRASEAICNVTQISFLKWSVVWIVCLSLASACFLKYFERSSENRLHFADAIFLSASATTATGLNSYDMTVLSKASLSTIMVATQLGSATFMSLVPVVIRVFYLRSTIPKKFRRLNLNSFKQVPEWLVEYKALIFLTKIVMAINALVYLCYGTLLYLLITGSESNMKVLIDEKETAAAVDGSAVYWTAFHTVSAYNNCGFSLQKHSFTHFSGSGGVLFVINMLVLHGNVLHPIFLRWIIIMLSAVTPRYSSRKVYFRYLLLNGRHLYSNLFGSQQTWLLLLQQVALILIQVSFTVWMTPRHPTISIALFEAVNVRHAGFSVIPLPDLSAGILIMFISFMYLAPMPYIAMLKSTMCSAAPPAGDGGDSISRRRASDDSDLIPVGITQNSRNLSLNMAKDNVGIERRHQADSFRWSEKAYSRNELSSVTRKSIMKEKLATKEMLDTRLLILTMYGEGQVVPWDIRIGLRLSAVIYQCRKLWSNFWSGVKLDMFLIWLCWWMICCIEQFKCNGEKIFYLLFEIVSSFGNVGLSLGSINNEHSNCSFAADLEWYSKVRKGGKTNGHEHHEEHKNRGINSTRSNPIIFYSTPSPQQMK